MVQAEGDKTVYPPPPLYRMQVFLGLIFALFLFIQHGITVSEVEGFDDITPSEMVWMGSFGVCPLEEDT